MLLIKTKSYIFIVFVAVLGIAAIVTATNSSALGNEPVESTDVKLGSHSVRYNEMPDAHDVQRTGITTEEELRNKTNFFPTEIQMTNVISELERKYHVTFEASGERHDYAIQLAHGIDTESFFENAFYITIPYLADQETEQAKNSYIISDPHEITDLNEGKISYEDLTSSSGGLEASKYENKSTTTVQFDKENDGVLSFSETTYVRTNGFLSISNRESSNRTIEYYALFDLGTGDSRRLTEFHSSFQFRTSKNDDWETAGISAIEGEELELEIGSVWEFAPLRILGSFRRTFVNWGHEQERITNIEVPVEHRQDPILYFEQSPEVLRQEIISGFLLSEETEMTNIEKTQIIRDGHFYKIDLRNIHSGAFTNFFGDDGIEVRGMEYDEVSDNEGTFLILNMVFEDDNGTRTFTNPESLDEGSENTRTDASGASGFSLIDYLEAFALNLFSLFGFLISPLGISMLFGGYVVIILVPIHKVVKR